MRIAATRTDERLKSGDLCTESGRYRFDGYVSEVTAPAPRVEDSELSLEIGHPFPLISSRSCYWKLIADLPGGNRSDVDKSDSPMTEAKTLQREGA